jgi:hypothetical protein
MPSRTTVQRSSSAAASIVLTFLALTACSPTAATGATGASPTATAAPITQPATPQATVGTPAATPGGGASTPAASTPASGGALTVAFSGLGAHPVLTPGGAALDFEVTVHNGSGTGYTDIQPLISMGHCSCGGGGAAMMPQGTLKLWNTASGSWQTIPYDAEGTGMDFSFVDQISGVALAAGADETFRYQVALSKPAHPVSNGSGTIDVTVQQLPAHTALIPTASTPVQVQVTR